MPRPDPTPEIYESLRQLTKRVGLSLKTIRQCLDHPLFPLPHYLIRGKILVKQSEFDEWMRHWKRGRVPRSEAAQIADEMMEGR